MPNALWAGPLLISAMLTGCGDASGPKRDSPPAQFAKVSGDHQSTAVTAALPQPLVVRVLDAQDRALPAVPVSWQVQSGGGSLAPAASTTTAGGEASASWTLGASAGTQQVVARVSGLDPVTFTAVALPGPPLAVVKVSGDGQLGVPANALPLPLVVRVEDAYGNAVASAAVEWSASTGSGSVSPPADTTKANGQASAVWTIGEAPSAQSARASVSGITPVSFTAVGTLALSVCLNQVLTGEAGCNVSSHPAQQAMPAVSGNRIVWQDYRTGLPAIFMFDLQTGELRQVTPPGTENVVPAIDGDRIVYARLAPNPGPWQFYHYHIPTATETLFSTVPREVGLGRFSISQDRIVWHTRRNGNWDVYLHDIATGEERRLTSDPADQADPVILGNRVAWVDRRHGSSWWDVYTLDLATGTERRITPVSTAGRAPALLADRVVWGDIRGSYFTLYQYPFAGGADATPIPTSRLENGIVAFGGYIAWHNRNDSNPSIFDDVFLYELASSRERRVTRHAARQWLPQLSAAYLVWEDYRSGLADIYVSRVDRLRPP